MNNNHSLILASASPRRQELLRQMGISFQVCPSRAEETLTGNESPQEAVTLLARRKAQDVARGFSPETLVLGADTVVCCDGRILGKPADEPEARRMLRSLSGRWHEVLTGLCLMGAGREISLAVTTRVRFSALTEERIDAYIATGEFSDKAGGYGIQSQGALLVEEIAGDYTNVVGLPVFALGKLLREEFGWPLP